jgi:hypothetical protein
MIKDGMYYKVSQEYSELKNEINSMYHKHSITIDNLEALRDIKSAS